MVWRADFVLRDREILSEIAQLYCSVAFFIDTTDDMLASNSSREPPAFGALSWHGDTG
jgi:hypothetical protein